MTDDDKDKRIADLTRQNESLQEKASRYERAHQMCTKGLDQEIRFMGDLIERIKNIETPFRKLIDKIEEVTTSAAYITVFDFHQTHGMKYKGETWEEEFIEAKEVLGPDPGPPLPFDELLEKLKKGELP